MTPSDIAGSVADTAAEAATAAMSFTDDLIEGASDVIESAISAGSQARRGRKLAIGAVVVAAIGAVIYAWRQRDSSSSEKESKADLTSVPDLEKSA